jgi:two-component sensor histidine kinase/ABC-type nitrate/sulfonate/bicarbonate transport system ATPase subunit
MQIIQNTNDNFILILDALCSELQQMETQVVLSVDTDMLDNLELALTRRLPSVVPLLHLGERPYSPIEEIEFIGKSERIISSFSVAQNLFGFNRSQGLFSSKRFSDRCQELVERFDFPLDPADIADSLSMEQRRMVELLRCFIRRPKIMVLNETLASFSYKNLIRVKEVLLSMKHSGTYMIYLTGKIEDIFRIGDRLFMFRPDGKTQSCSVQTIRENPQQLYDGMLGDAIGSVGEKGLKKDFYHALGIVREGTNQIISRENLTHSIKNYVRYSESIFPHGNQCKVYLFNSNGDNLSSEISDQPSPKLNRDILFAFPTKNEVFYASCNDAMFESFFEDRRNCNSVICLPVVLSDKTVGVLQLTFENYYFPAQTEIDLLWAISQRISEMLEMSHLLEKSMLLQESNHRIKNNLQLIVSMLLLQRNQVSNTQLCESCGEELCQILNDTISRIQSIASVHDLLSRENVIGGLMDMGLLFEEIRHFYGMESDLYMEIEGRIGVAYSHWATIVLILN